MTKYEKLIKKHKSLFPKGGFGMECGEGWIELIEFLCKFFENKIKNKEVKSITFAQIKEKFGLLRIYFDMKLPKEEKESDPNRMYYEVHQTLSTLEEISGIVCEDCGQMKHEGFDVKMRNHHGWLMTRCDKCFEEQITEYKKRMKE